MLPRLYTQVIQKNFEDYSDFSTSTSRELSSGIIIQNRTNSPSRHWKEEPKAPAGYLLAELLNGYTDEGYRFQFVRFVQAENLRNQEPVFYG